jgi:hypothetical protein
LRYDNVNPEIGLAAGFEASIRMIYARRRPPRRCGESVNRFPAGSVLARCQRDTPAFLQDTGLQRDHVRGIQRQGITLQRIYDAPVGHFPKYGDLSLKPVDTCKWSVNPFAWS